MRKSLSKALVWYLVSAMFVIGIVPRAYAGLSPSEALMMQKDLPSDLEKVQKFLEMKIVRERLQELGLTAGEMQAKLSQLSDSQIHQLALKIDDLKVGGDAAGVIIAILLIAILVVLLIYLTGHRVIVR